MSEQCLATSSAPSSLLSRAVQTVISRLKPLVNASENEQFAKLRVRALMTIGVLIVEDEFLVRMDAVDFMRDFGFTVHEASNADEAIALLELHSDIRAVFTDIHMPGSMDGLKLAHYVRGRWPPIKLIITSGHARPLVEDMPLGCGFVSKPYQLERVAADLRTMTL